MVITMKEGKTIARKVAKVQRQSIASFQGKSEVKAWLKNLVVEYGINSAKDIKEILNALLESPFLEYEPVGQVAYNEPRVIAILNRYEVQR